MIPVPNKSARSDRNKHLPVLGAELFGTGWKRLLILGLFALLWGSPARAAVAYVGGASSTSGQCTAGNSGGCSCTYTSTTGNTYFIEATAHAAASSTWSSPADSGGDTFTQQVAANNAGGGGGNVYSVIYATTAGGGHASTSFSIHISDTHADIVCSTEEYSGVTGFGATNTNGDGTGNSTVATVSLTMSSSSNWAIAAHAARQSGNDATANTGNLRHSNNVSASDHIQGSTTDNTGSTTVTNSVNIGATTYFVSVALELKAGSAAAPAGFNKKKKLEKLDPGAQTGSLALAPLPLIRPVWLRRRRSGAPGEGAVLVLLMRPARASAAADQSERTSTHE